MYRCDAAKINYEANIYGRASAMESEEFAKSAIEQFAA